MLDQKPDNILSNQENKLARRSFLVKSSLVVGGAVLSLTAGGIAFKVTHAAGNTQKTDAKSFVSNKGLPVFRFVHEGGHFYTIDPAEAAAAGPKFGFTYEGVAFNAFKPGQAPAGTITVIRLAKGFDHFYTIDPNEAAAAHKQLGYTLEGPAFNVYKTSQNGTVAVYRLHSPNEGHFYVAGLAAARIAEKQYGFTFEPPVGKNQNPTPYFYALPASSNAKF